MMEIERALAATEVGPLSHPTRVYPSWKFSIVEVGYIRLRWERVGVRGYGPSRERNPSPAASRRPLPLGEVKRVRRDIGEYLTASDLGAKIYEACAAATATGSDSATMTSSSSNPPSQYRLVGCEGCAVRTLSVTNWKSLQVGKPGRIARDRSAKKPIKQGVFQKIIHPH